MMIRRRLWKPSEKLKESLRHLQQRLKRIFGTQHLHKQKWTHYKTSWIQKGTRMTFHHTPEPTCPLCEEKLLTAHKDLQVWFREAKRTFPDMHVSWAWRGKTDQEKAF